MPEIKNTFIKSKMNQDLDSRLLPNGEYREGVNISVSTAEGPDVGSLENIAGNTPLIDLQTLGVDNIENKSLEIIGKAEDVANDRIILFYTNFDDGTFDNGSFAVGDASSSPRTRTGAKCYIVLYNIISGDASIIVSGSFLNFSKSAPIVSTNIIENILYWTDNRNQPRKINIETAILDNSYYSTEDHISLARYAPVDPIEFIKNNEWGTTINETSMINEYDEYLPPFVSGVYTSTINTGALEFIIDFSGVTNPSNQSLAAELSTLAVTSGGVWSNAVADYYKIRVTNADKPGTGEYFIRVYLSGVATPASEERFVLSSTWTTTAGPAITAVPDGWAVGDVLNFQKENPDYNSNFVSNSKDNDFLKDKFVRFSYRFKYDDNEYSLMAPFSQAAFIPKQYGYWLKNDDEKTKESGIVAFMENQVTTVDLRIPMPSPMFSPNAIRANELNSTIKAEEIQILMKESDSLAVKVVGEIDQEDFGTTGILTVTPVTSLPSGTGYTTGVCTTSNISSTGTGASVSVTANGAGQITFVGPIVASGEGYKVGDTLILEQSGASNNIEVEVVSVVRYLTYKYSSEKPIKVLDEKEITRVSDITPMKALTQEAVGNRVVYGNFLQNLKTPDYLDFDVTVAEKSVSSPVSYTDDILNIELPNHTLKQNRTYEVGIVLFDRYGRSSNVILGKNGSSVYSPYTNGGDNPLEWFGNCLQIAFNEVLPEQKTEEYVGLFSESNPLGWYSYRVVVKQLSEEYYNIYVPGTTTGNITFTDYATGLTYPDDNNVGNISLFNDNINKLPRDLSEVGPQDKLFSSSKILYNRLYLSDWDASIDLQIPKQDIFTLATEVTDIKPFRELGDWTKYKNVDVHYLNIDASGTGPESQYPVNTFPYPGDDGEIDPLFNAQKNPYIATLKTPERYGFYGNKPYTTYAGGMQAYDGSAIDFQFSKKLNVYEVKPEESAIDIYYETSTSGLIKLLNSEIRSSGALPTDLDINYFTFSFREDQTGGAELSNEFEVVTASGVYANNQNAIITLLKTFHTTSLQAGVPIEVTPSPFSCSETTPGSAGSSPKYTMVLKTNSERAYLSDSYLADQYTFQFKLEDGLGNSRIVEKTGRLSNVSPSIPTVELKNGDYIIPSGPGPISSGDTIVWNRKDFNSQISSGSVGDTIIDFLGATNGSANTTANTYGLKWEIINVRKEWGKWDKDTDTFTNIDQSLSYTVTGPAQEFNEWRIKTFSNGSQAQLIYIGEDRGGGVFPIQKASVNARENKLGNYAGRYRGAIRWILNVRCVDAGGNTGSLDSNTIQLNFIVKRTS